MKQTYILQPAPHPSRKRAMQAVADAPDGHCVTVSEPSRNLDQNAAMWPCLQAFSDQLEWPVNGAMSKLTPDEWKDVFTASLKRQKVVPGLDGGFVVCGLPTSKMGKSEFSQLLDLAYAFGAEKEVKFHDAI